MNTAPSVESATLLKAVYYTDLGIYGLCEFYLIGFTLYNLKSYPSLRKSIGSVLIIVVAHIMFAYNILSIFIPLYLKVNREDKKLPSYYRAAENIEPVWYYL